VRRAVLLCLSVLALSAGCADLRSEPCGEGIEWPWGEPEGSSVTLAQLQRDGSLVHRPEGLGEPSSVTRTSGGTVTFAFSTSAGRYWIVEKPTPSTKLPGVVPLCGDREELSIRQDVPAALIYGESTRYLTWFEDGLRIQVIGDSQDITREEVIEIASHVT
jgi:hypothetical protein